MIKTAKTMRWTTVALLAGALALPGLTLAHGHDGHRGDWDDRVEWNDRGHDKRHWRHDRHDHWRRWDRDRRVVVVPEPVYVSPHRPDPPPPWVPLAIGIAGLLHDH
jgi:hypothetical protein